MENKAFKPAGRNYKKIILIVIASLIAVGLIGYGTLALLRQIKAPTVSGDPQTQTQAPAKTTPAVSPEKALEVADKAYASAVEKAAAGDQKAALADYKTAHENYKLADNTLRADEASFAIKSTEAILAVPENPAKPEAKVGAKE